MTDHPVWKIFVLVALIVIPGSLLAVPLYLAYRKFKQNRLAAVPRVLAGCDVTAPRRGALHL